MDSIAGYVEGHDLTTEWNHVCGTWDGAAGVDNIHLYINGSPVDSSGTGTTVVDGPANNLRMGASSLSDFRGPYNGLIDDVRFYNYVLSDNEIFQLYSEYNPQVCIGYWNFDELSGGTLHDISGNGNHGIIYGADWDSGCNGGALNFDGIDDYVLVPHADLFEISEGTIEVIFRPHGGHAIGDPKEEILQKEGYGQFDGDTEISLSATGLLEVEVETPVVRIWSDPYTAPFDDGWYHVAYVFGPTGMKMYVDGVLQADQDPFPASWINNDRDLVFGYNIHSVEAFHGLIDEVRITEGQLPPEEFLNCNSIYDSLVGYNLMVMPYPPVHGEEAEISFLIENDGQSTWIKRPLVAHIKVEDYLDNPPLDSFWLQMYEYPRLIRQDKFYPFEISQDLEPGQSELVTFPFKFISPDFSDALNIEVYAYNGGEWVDSEKESLAIQSIYGTDFIVDFNPQAYLNCFGELMTGLTSGIYSNTYLCYAGLAIRVYRDFGTQTGDIESAFNIISELPADDSEYIQAGSMLMRGLLSWTNHLNSLIYGEGFCDGQVLFGNIGLLFGYINAMFNEFTNMGCGAVLVHEFENIMTLFIQGLLHMINTDPVMSAFNIDDRVISLITACPVEIQAVSTGGDTTSVDLYGNVQIDIENSQAFIIGDSLRVILVPDNATYEMKMFGSEIGNADVSIIQGKNDGTSVAISYYDVLINPLSTAMIDISNESEDYTLYLDMDGDNFYEDNIAPDAIEIVEYIPTAVEATELQNDDNSLSTMHLFPNPFNPAITIKFNIKKTTNIKMQIYDISGRLVKNLFNGCVFEAGSHKVVWDGLDEINRDTASGIYFCRIQTEDYVETKRMTLIR